MEKLELKHIAPYLPYGLKVLSSFGELATISSVHLTDLSSRKSVNLQLDGVPISFRGDNLDTIKPILRPLSDLTKEIEAGEKFIPLMVLASDGFENREKKRFYIESDNETFFNVMYNTGSPDDDCIFSIDTPIKFYTKYHVVQQLHEWHFDTEGLIEKGLAIDINTLK